MLNILSAPRVFRLLLLVLGTAPAVAPAATTAAPGLPAYVDAIDRQATDLYGPFLSAKGLKFSIVRDLDSPLAVASARRDKFDDLRVVFDRGFLEAPRLTPDAYRFALCHEIGHLVGGAPRRPPPMEWDGPVDAQGNMLMSAESQADYYAAQACFRRMVAGQDHRAELAGKQISSKVQAACDLAWTAGTNDAAICIRATIGAYEMLRLVAPFPISFDAHDDTVVEKTVVGYPDQRQCRLDTALAGASCRAESGLEWDGLDARKDGCRREAGARPACWYRE